MKETSYIYTGPSKIYERPATKKEKTTLTFKKMCFVIVGSYAVNNVKSKGNRILQKYEDSEIFEYQLDFAHAVCDDPEIILITGIDQKEFLKHPRRSECSIIENPFYEFTNSAEEIRIASMACRSPEMMFFDGAFIPKFSITQEILKCNKSKAFYRDLGGYDKPGIVLTGENPIITSYNYSSKNKLIGLYYLNKGDVDRLRKKTIGSSFSKNKFFYEMLNEIKMLSIKDETTILC